MSKALIINLVKPRGMTSMQAVSRIKRLLEIKKAGHTGTLDPNVSGVLPVFTGMATKLIHAFENGTKEYKAEITFGITTDTQDGDGNVLSKNPVEANEAELINVIKSFEGEITQIPPMYSAVKVNGQKLYDLARKGIEIERKERRTTIFSIEILQFTHGENPRVSFIVNCSRGTYIRTLCADIGEKLGSGAYMSDLVRTRSGDFLIDEGVTFEQIEENLEDLSKVSLSIEAICSKYTKIELDDFIFNKFMNGVNIFYEKLNIKLDEKDELVRIYNKNEFVALGEVIHGEENYVKMYKQFLN